MSDYYNDLREFSENPAIQVGWRHRIEQAYRFEVALDALFEARTVLDVGCGDGAFARYLRGRRVDAAWTGLERDVAFADRASAEGPVYRADFRGFSPEKSRQYDCAVAIGTLSGFDRPAFEDLVSFCTQIARSCCIVFLDHAAVSRTSLVLETALGTVTEDEVQRAVAALADPVRLQTVTRTDRALFVGTGIEDLRSNAQRFEATIAGPWGDSADPARVAWLAYEIGEDELAERWVRRANPDHPLARIVRERLA